MIMCTLWEKGNIPSTLQVLLQPFLSSVTTVQEGGALSLLHECRNLSSGKFIGGAGV